MKPLDPRLLRYARAARGVFVLGALFGLLRTLAIIAWCWSLAQMIAAAVLPIIGMPTGLVSDGSFALTDLSWLALVAVAALFLRSLASWGTDVVAARGAVKVKQQLRGAALDALDVGSPERGDGKSDAELTTSLGRGLDALDGYFSGYVPQLILTVIATPLLVLSVFLADPVSAITVLIVFPVIPLFMIMIGMATQAVQDRQWAQLQHLSASFLDVVSGLSTLKIFGREQRQSERIARETDEYRSRTMKVLRVTFLSGFVLDLAGTFSIALVAVTVGTRLVSGDFPLALGLFVLLLLPEVFIPIRQVGAAFHASTEGLSASAEVFEIIEGSADAGWIVDGYEARGERSPLGFAGVEITRNGRSIMEPVSFEVAPGELVVLAGPSGSGKSTLLSALLGFVNQSAGTVYRPYEVAWVGQRAGLLQGTVASNVALGDPEPDAEMIDRALVAAALPGLAQNTVLGASGAGLSGGQAQRVSIARCLYRAWRYDVGAVLLDEPTSALDAASEAAICAALRAEANAGRAVLVVSHRPGVLEAADRVVRVAGAAYSESPAAETEVTA
ncbi:thiol reductant ABC exporter subunit CydD [Leucobacter insecticola]|uniref:Thiol reductant ABC exporter subunit CydD n=1 Tax=Leucobacter insecticola TaxID=2714934 RepID=A0A6G8FJV8_9MICO|nr:thiol reductant ABC exporter subunit CydD [Leucobacter insecticola]QIM16655.1 thiol reductant ABC exporter subunit CydD [Leucobacter insecticola]